jgi:anti-sigma B factor antagonist
MKPAGDVTVAEIRGSLDGLSADKLLRALMDEINSGRKQLVADCSALDYISSAGLRTLLGAVKAARQKGGDLRLAALRPPVLKVLDLSGFTSILKSYPDPQDAVASFGK